MASTNTTTSRTGVVTGSAGGPFTTTFNVGQNHQGVVYLLLEYSKGDGTSVAVSPITVKDVNLATTVYNIPASEASGSTLGAYTLTINATGNYVISIAIPLSTTSITVVSTYTGGTTATLVTDIVL